MLKRKILIISCRRNGLAVIRALKEDYIIAVDHFKSHGMYSKYIDERHIVPDRIKFEKEFISSLLDIANFHSEKIYLLPTNDDYLEIFVRNKHLLIDKFIFVFESEKEILESCVDKLKVFEKLSKTNIHFPSHYSINNVKDQQINFPVIIKPSNKKDTKLVGQEGVFRIKKCYNIFELENAMIQLEEYGASYVIQDLIEGDDSNLYACGVFSFKGKLFACFTGRKIRQFPPMTGEGSYAESLISDELVNLSKLVVSELNFTGIANIEFKLFNGKYYFIEMNPRPWSFNGLSTYCGVNLPKIAIDFFSSTISSDEIILNNRNGKWIFAYEDLIHNVLLNKNISFFKFLRDLSTANSFAYFDKNDIMPAIRYYIFDSLNLLKHYLKLTIKKNNIT